MSATRHQPAWHAREPEQPYAGDGGTRHRVSTLLTLVANSPAIPSGVQDDRLMALWEHKYRLKRPRNPHQSPASEFATSVIIGYCWRIRHRLSIHVSEGSTKYSSRLQ